MAAAARGSFQANGAGTGKDVHHPRAIDGLGIGMAQYIEQALARAVRCRANVVRLRHRKRPTAKLTADDPHRASTPSALWAAPAGTAAIRATAARTTRRATSPTGLAREAACTARLSTRLAAKGLSATRLLAEGLAGRSVTERTLALRAIARRPIATGRTIAARTLGTLLAIEGPGARTLVALGAGPAVTTGTIAEWPIATGLVTIRTITARLVAEGPVAARRTITDWAITARAFGASFALEGFRARAVTTLGARAARTIANRTIPTRRTVAL